MSEIYCVTKMLSNIATSTWKLALREDAEKDEDKIKKAPF